MLLVLRLFLLCCFYDVLFCIAVVVVMLCCWYCCVVSIAVVSVMLFL